MVGKVLSPLFILALLFLGAGCSGVSRKQTVEFKKFYRSGQYQNAIEMIRSNRYYANERSRLLHYLELGTLYHLQHKFFHSLTYFNAAQELSDKLFTVSIKKKIASYMVSDNSDNYYGEIYERSQIRLYLALNHLMLAQVGEYEAHSKNLFSFIKKKKKKKGAKSKSGDDNKAVTLVALQKLTKKKIRFHYQAARAVIIEWNSYLEAQKKVLLGADQYKGDLAQHLFGAHVHLRMESRSDRRIAKSLYKESKNLLFKNYNIYPSYNAKYVDFRKDFSKLPKLKKSLIRKKYIDQTKHAKNLISYIDQKLKNKKKNLVTFFIREGSIPQKKADKVDFPIGFGALTYTSVGKKDFLSFVGKIMAVSTAGASTISFELPRLESIPAARALELQLKDDQGKLAFKKVLALVNPLGDLAKEALKKRLPSLRAKVGARLVAKHVAALMTSYLAFRVSKKKNGEFIALSLATAAYYVANRSIAASEKADLRSWMTLPANLYMTDVAVKPGTYQVSIIDKVSGLVRQLDPLVVAKGSKKLLYSKRVM